MIAYWAFCDAHPFLGWCSLWILLVLAAGGIKGVSLLFSLLFRLANRVLRTINILFRGWPPAHLDADGDFRPIPKADSLETSNAR